MMFLFLVIAVCVSTIQCADVTFDLSTGTVSGSHPAITLQGSMAISAQARPDLNKCKYQGQVRINFAAAAGKTEAQIDFHMSRPYGHVYHIADQKYTNGYGGTRGAEIHGYWDTGLTYIQHTPAGFREESPDRHLLKNRIPHFHDSNHVQYKITNKRVSWDNTENVRGVSISQRLFPSVTNGGDRSLWIGMNRVNSYYTPRMGMGLCTVKITLLAGPSSPVSLALSGSALARPGSAPRRPTSLRSEGQASGTDTEIVEHVIKD